MTNIAKILKNAPKGLKLYSSVHGEITLNSVDLTLKYYPIETSGNLSDITNTFTKYEELYDDFEDAECVLFPSKEHKSWDNWQEVLFKVGDIVTNTENNVTFIYNGYTESWNEFYVYTKNGLQDTMSPEIYRYATPEEREQFMAELNANGYKWNADTKQIEKIEQQYTPKYKVGDWIINNNGNICDVKKVNEIVTYKDNSIHYRLYNLNSRCVGDYQLKDIDSNFRLVTEEEKAKLISRGDIEKPFTIDDFKPFDKVLTRNNPDGTWSANYYSHKVKLGYVCVAGFTHSYCIPYNDETKHLLGTTDDCQDKYKTL